MFIERLKDLLKEKGITNTKFCEDIQINKNQIRRWEVIGTTPNRTTLTVIANSFAHL